MYRVIDLQDNQEEIYHGENSLKEFANDLYWDDEIDFFEKTEEETIKAIEGCDYIVEVMEG